MSKMLLAGLALLAGVGLAVQVGMNSGLKERAGHPISAALISFLTGTVVLAVYALATRPGLAPPRELLQGPWWIWMGGTVGAVYVASAAAYGRQLGAVAWLGLTITGQVGASIVLDHFGLVGFPAHPINPPRLLGALLLLAGVVLVLRW